MKRYCIFLLCCLLWANNTKAAQDSTGAAAQFTASNLSPLVGETVDLTLVVTLPAGATLMSWPNFPTQWSQFEVRDVGEVIVEESDSNVTYRQNLSVLLWTPGETQTPEMTLSYQLTEGSDRLPLSVAPAFFLVPSVLTSPNPELRPLRPPVSLPYVSPQVIILVLAVLIAGIYWAYERWKVGRSRRADLDRLALNGLDRAALNKLKAIDPQRMAPTALYAAAADCLRDYTQQQFGLPAHQMTTTELLRALDRDLPASLRQGLQELLLQADIVKFSLHQPQRREGHNYLETTARWIQATARDRARQSHEQKDAV